PESLPDVTRRPQAVQRCALMERGVQILPHESRARRRRARADSVLFEKHDPDARGSKGRRAGASRQPAADDDDICTDLAALTWVLGPPGTREGIEKIRNEPHAPLNSNLNGMKAV